jgi:hypothetical protein
LVHDINLTTTDVVLFKISIIGKTLLAARNGASEPPITAPKKPTTAARI